MRKTSELLQVMLDNIDQLESGLCLLATKLETWRVISQSEELKICKYIIKTQSIFNPYYPYLFERRDKVSRVEWLKEHIELTKQSD